MNKKLKIIITVIVIIIAIVLLILFYLTRGLQEGQNIEVNNVDLSYLEDDGFYTGNFKFGRWSNEAKVTLEDRKIMDIEFTDDVSFSKDEVREEIINRIIDKQKVNVDVVSGATVTSKAYMKAVEDALDILH
ncbi:MAG: FMN-binding protein [Bacillota bacterium]|nr:FMN-binding protein [Bacillota bacterium]